MPRGGAQVPRAFRRRLEYEDRNAGVRQQRGAAETDGAGADDDNSLFQVRSPAGSNARSFGTGTSMPS